jgi:hypothetical protein
MNFLHHVYNSILSFNVFQIKNVPQKADEGYKSLLLLMTTIGKFLPLGFIFIQVQINCYLLNIFVYVALKYVVLVVVYYNLDIIFCKIQTQKCAN